MSLPYPNPYCIFKNDLVIGDTTGTPLSGSTGKSNRPHKEIQANVDYIYSLLTNLSMGGYSNTLTQMRSQVNPYPASVESLATTLYGEIERIRYQLKLILGEDYWYYVPDSNLNDTVTKSNLQNNVHTYTVLSGTNTYTGSLTPALTTYTNTKFTAKVTNANTSTTPTINLSSLGPKTIKRNTGALYKGDIQAGGIYDFEYNGTDFIILNPSKAGPSESLNSIHILPTAGSTAGTRNITLPAGTWQLILESNATCQDSSGTYTQVASIEGISLNTSITFDRSGSSGFGRKIYGYDMDVNTLILGDDTTVTMAISAGIPSTNVAGNGSKFTIERIS